MSRYSEIRRQITHRANLAQYLESELGLSINWSSYESGMCVCPLHGDTQPSFSISQVDGVWLFNCFGCHESGTIIEFFLRYYQLDSIKTAMELICERFDISESLDTIRESMCAIGGRFDLKKRTTSAHIVTANKCRIMLGGDPTNKGNISRIVEVYGEMNQALVENDFTRIEEIAEEISCAIRENSPR